MPDQHKTEQAASDLELMEDLLQQEATFRVAAIRGATESPRGLPDDEMLFDYLGGRLDEAATERMRDQLVASPELAERLREMHELMDVEVSSQPGVTDRSAHAAWRDFEDRAESMRRAGPPARSWTAWAAVVLLMVSGGLGLRLWQIDQEVGRSGLTGPLQVQAVILQRVRDVAEQEVKAGLPLSVQLPLSASQGDCERIEVVLRQGDEERSRVILEPILGQVHWVLPALEAGDYVFEVIDCQGTRQSLAVRAVSGL